MQGEGTATCAFGERGRIFHMQQPNVTLWKRPRWLDRVSPLQWRPLNAHRSFCCIPGSPLDRELIVCASTRPLSLIITCRRISRNDLPKVSQSYLILEYIYIYIYNISNPIVDFYFWFERGSSLPPFIYLSRLLEDEGNFSKLLFEIFVENILTIKLRKLAIFNFWNTRIFKLKFSF